MTTPNDTAAGRPRRAADSARWCERCQKYGDHHTDRHDECAPAEATWETKERDRLAVRAAHYADDARNIVARVTLYEDVHPDDAPCLESLLRAIPGIAWRGHDA